MIHGAHVIIYSKDAEADRAFFRDVLEYPNVDAGGGWLIFKLPPTELAVHPSGNAEKHEIYLMCDNIGAFVAKMAEHNLSCSEVHTEPWGELVSLTMPGGGSLGVYEPRHASPSS